MLTWTTEEEQSFTRLMELGRLTRPEAIRLYRRCKDNFGKAMVIATAEAPSSEEIARRAAFGESARTRAARKRQALAA
jgi:hypothetical protein